MVLSAQAVDASGAAVGNKTFVWSTNAFNVATVSSDGTLTGLAAGVVSVTASTDGKTGSLDLTILPPPVASVLVTVPAPSVTVGQTMTAAVVVKDAAGNTLTGRSVTWSSLDQTVASITSAGVITGLKPGTTSIVATSETITGSATLTVVATPPGPAASIAKLNGDLQTAVVGTSVAVPPSVLVTDAQGRPVPLSPVTFAIASGAGSFSTASSLAVSVVNTGTDGTAAIGLWRLGPSAGTQSITASIGNGQAVTFSATAIASAATSFQKIAGDAQTAIAGTQLPIAPSVRLVDANGNPVAGIVVTFSVLTGSGSIAGATKTTDAAGTATVDSWTLGSLSGPNSVSASSPSVPVNVLFTATAVPGPASTIKIVSGDNQSPTAGTTSLAPLVFEIRDVRNNLVSAGTKVVFTVTGGTMNPATGTTDSVGTVKTFWNAPTLAKAYTGSATVEGTTISVPFGMTATGAQSKMYIIEGNQQSAVKGTAVAIKPRIQIHDQYGNPTPSLTVVFSITAGGGTVTGATQITDANGYATLGGWTLGDRLLKPTNRTDSLYVVVPTNPDINAIITADATYPAVPNVQTWEYTSFGSTSDAPAYLALGGTSASDIWAVGFRSVMQNLSDNIRHFTGAVWNAVGVQGMATLRGVWASTTANVVATGDNGTIVRYNGSNWITMTSPTTRRLNWVWGATASNVYAVGDSGTVLQFDGVSWSALPALGTMNLYGVWGRSANDVYIVGQGGHVRHFDGSTWTVMNSSTTQDLYSIWGYSASEVIAVGTQRVIVRYDGSSWITQSVGSASEPPTTYRGVWGSAPNDNYISFTTAVSSGLVKYDMSGNPVGGALPTERNGPQVSNPWGVGVGSDVWFVNTGLTSRGIAFPVISRGRR